MNRISNLPVVVLIEGAVVCAVEALGILVAVTPLLGIVTTVVSAAVVAAIVVVSAADDSDTGAVVTSKGPALVLPGVSLAASSSSSSRRHFACHSRPIGFRCCCGRWRRSCGRPIGGDSDR